VDFLFVKVGGDAAHSYCDMLGYGDPSSSLVEAYGDHFSVDSLVFYLASAYFGCCLEDFFKPVKGLHSKPLSICRNLVSDRFDAVLNESIDGNFNQ
jgi:hypothetical protein